MVSEIKISKGRKRTAPCRCFSSLHLYSTLLPQMYGRLPEVRLVGPCHGIFTPVRISHSRPPCVIPIMGAGTGRKYPPAGVMARQPTTGCFWDGWNRSSPCLAVILHRVKPCAGGLGAPSPVAHRCRERVQDRIFNFQSSPGEFVPLLVYGKFLAS